MARTNKNLFSIVEKIAEKELERDPVNFIRTESILVKANIAKQSMQSNEESKHNCNYESDEDMTFGEPIQKVYSNAQFDIVNNDDDDGQKIVLGKELEDVFFDAYDFIPSNSIKIKRRQLPVEEQKSEEEGNIEPLERTTLPFLKDPKTKISVWAILKDAIGKDLSKMSLPVYFNDPSNILQRNAIQMEYNYILEDAIKQTESIRRLAYVSVYATSMFTNLAKSCAKPFNPMLGETFELVNPKFTFLAEQVSHHPPVTAWQCVGKAGYKVWSNSHAKTKFTGKSISVVQMYKKYMELLPFNETYEVSAPEVSIHNLIIGTPYIDIGGK